MPRQLSSTYRTRKSVKKKHTFLHNAVLFYNVLFILLGVTLLTTGVVTLLLKNNYTSLLSNPTYTIVTYLYVVVSGVILAMGIVGCVGVVRERRGLLLLYSVFLVLLCLAEALAGVLAYTYHATIEDELARQFNSTVLTVYSRDGAVTRSIDHLQTTFHCCGSGSYLDWRSSDWITSNTTTNLVPDSCCISPSEDCGTRDHPSNIYTRGCMTHLIEFVRQHLMVVGAMALIVAFTQIFGMVFACCFARRIKLDKESKSESLMASYR